MSERERGQLDSNPGERLVDVKPCQLPDGEPVVVQKEQPLATPQTAPSCPPDGAGADFSALRDGGRDPQTGRFQRGNLAALTHGLRARTLLEQPELAEAHAEKVAAIEQDLGADLSTLKASAVREAARLALIVDSLGHDLLTKGVITPKGKTRAALSAYVMTLDRLTKLQTLLGLERRSRSLPTTVAGIVANLERG